MRRWGYIGGISFPLCRLWVGGYIGGRGIETPAPYTHLCNTFFARRKCEKRIDYFKIGLCNTSYSGRGRRPREPPSLTSCGSGNPCLDVPPRFLCKQKSHTGSLLPSLRIRSVPPVSLRLGHARVLTVHRTVIHYAHAASLPEGRGLRFLQTHYSLRRGRRRWRRSAEEK